MDTRNITYFMAVFEHLHFTKAAEILGISQPTLSQQIRLLEAEVGMPLFDRIGKKVVATEAGRLLHQYGMKMIQAEMDAKSAIQELVSEKRGTVRLAVLPSDLDFQLVPLFVEFKTRYPHTKLQAFSTIFVRDEVLTHKVDLGIGLRGPKDKRLVQIPLGSEPYELFVHASSDLAKKHEITLDELTRLALVMYPKGYIGRDLVDEVFRDQGLELTTVMEAGSASSLLQLVAAGIGATIQPRELLKQHSGWEDIATIPIVGPAPVRHMELTYYADRFISKAQHQLAEWLIEFFKSKTN
ncbi:MULTISPECIES: LysR family transcriptional regulator [Paenibacillus]|uniref:LysR family transcriptional regulator n=1 Tax=Paenibacillus cucumis (ex Kampfer et al. 2016) TaxID=1776858 RepID=A0ABS7KH52_9BACL|nr:LysR family transcriptional regulator [Paenibacillus cucumis (ex Kampfer et al. 2016)]MBY0203262.1 LysR family transcriptional regulator [Paenibacillus cucumis (ex Kampfer et al. 2016)]MDP9697716.1 DNA-binding transcriptional LysR family regulator [Paenibacillus intestini]